MFIKFLNKKGQEFEIDCGEDEILLQAGLRNGVYCSNFKTKRQNSYNEWG